jgi:protein ImuB
VADREHQRVGVAELLDTHRPDAFRVVPFSPSAKLAQLRAASAEPVNALRRFRPALQANVEVRGGVPHRMTVLGATLPAPGYLRGEVVHASGPWRCSGEWWDEHAWAREEWDVAFRSERELLLYRVHRDLNSGAWSVEGEFD